VFRRSAQLVWASRAGHSTIDPRKGIGEESGGPIFVSSALQDALADIGLTQRLIRNLLLAATLHPGVCVVTKPIAAYSIAGVAWERCPRGQRMPRIRARADRIVTEIREL